MKKSKDTFLAIGPFAERAGVAASAVRFYETKGLISSTRTPGGQRRYARSELRRLSFILICQRLGFTLRQIQETLSSLPEGRTPSKRDWERLSRGFQEEIEERIRGLQAVRDRLTSCIGCGCLSLQSCRLYNPEDRANSNGPGPRYLLTNEDSGY